MLDLNLFAHENGLTMEDLVDLLMDFVEEMGLGDDLEEFLEENVDNYRSYAEEEDEEELDEEEPEED